MYQGRPSLLSHGSLWRSRNSSAESHHVVAFGGVGGICGVLLRVGPVLLDDGCDFNSMMYIRRLDVRT